MKFFKPKDKPNAPTKVCVRCGRLTISMTDRCMGINAKNCTNLQPDIIEGWWKGASEII